MTFETFKYLLDGRTDAHGAWWGEKLDGPPDYDAHLTTGPYVGVYCVSDDNLCKWGCVDIDGKDFTPSGEAPWEWEAMWDTANLLVDALDYQDCTAWTERTTNGIHVWVFADERVSAATMRRALLAACQVIDYQPKEVNPKQEEVNVDKPFGNYVRLPYYGAISDGTPADRFVIDEDGPLTVEQWCRLAHQSMAPVSTLEHMAGLYAPPVQHAANLRTETVDIVNLIPILPPVVRMIWEDGPLNGDRSSALVKSAVILRDDGWQAQAIYDVLDALDAKLGKFVGRDDREQQLLNIIEKVL